MDQHRTAVAATTTIPAEEGETFPSGLISTSSPSRAFDDDDGLVAVVSAPELLHDDPHTTRVAPSSSPTHEPLLPSEEDHHHHRIHTTTTGSPCNVVPSSTSSSDCDPASAPTSQSPGSSPSTSWSGSSLASLAPLPPPPPPPQHASTTHPPLVSQSLLGLTTAPAASTASTDLAGEPAALACATVTGSPSPMVEATTNTTAAASREIPRGEGTVPQRLLPPPPSDENGSIPATEPPRSQPRIPPSGPALPPPPPSLPTTTIPATSGMIPQPDTQPATRAVPKPNAVNPIHTSATTAPVEVIELLDDDDDDDEQDVGEGSNHLPQSTEYSAPPAIARVAPSHRKRPRPDGGEVGPLQVPVPPQAAAKPPPLPPPPPLRSTGLPTHSHAASSYDRPEYLSLPPGFRPTWGVLVPTENCVESFEATLGPRRPLPSSGAPIPRRLPPLPTRHKSYKLSLLSVRDFTISGLAPDYGRGGISGLGEDGPPTSLSGLRVPIRRIAKPHGGASFERDPTPANEGAAADPGKWRIPLGAYHPLAAWLASQPETLQVVGIPPHQLQAASLEQARQARGHPSANDLIRRGVPRQVAHALAPFQRGGVDFVLDKNGRALVADDMGLGKTIQGIASMAAYRKEWPLLVLCPSSARYHWESELVRWLGPPGPNDGVSAEKDPASSPSSAPDVTAEAYPAPPLEARQVHVLSSSRADILPHPDTQAVVCTYGLAPILVKAGRLAASQFGCAIVDESHMLKNKASQRAKCLVPLLRDIGRCVLLSGTPALARPAELWPQLDALRVPARNSWWRSEEDFVRKYVKRGGPADKAELHTMLTGTIMIRRLKNDILKDLPRKFRSKAVLHVLTSDQCQEFKGLLAQLRQSKGTLGNLARTHHASPGDSADTDEPRTLLAATYGVAPPGPLSARAAADAALRAELDHRLLSNRLKIHESLSAAALQFDLEQRNALLLRLEGDLRASLDREYVERSAALEAQFGPLPDPSQSAESKDEGKRKVLLSHMYSLTGDVKIPVIVDMLRRWLQDPTKGKLCIFAHHLSVLNAIRDQAELTNEPSSQRKFIRIDGATPPKQRQEQIKSFQTDPSVRVALLGITAAGVAVTLVASSTVWFAELFWTPALMIQAEDRCHRIGQQARVECLYFVAKGTLDEILWKLIEKKFQDLGEFVEGKEKLKLVVEKVFESEKELHSMFESSDGVDDAMGWGDDDETGIDNAFTMDDFADDFALLGQEECDMLRIDSDDEEDADGSAAKVRSEDRLVAGTQVVVGPAGQGRTEDEAIVLDDDDEEDEKPAPSQAPASHGMDRESASKMAGNTPAASTVGPEPVARNPDSALSFPTDFRLYKLRIGSPRLGIELSLYRGRAFVARIFPDRIHRLGEHSKPDVGDILVAVNNWPLPPAPNIEKVINLVKSLMVRLPFDLTFAESPALSHEYGAYVEEMARRSQVADRGAGPKIPAADEVIELVDDDDEEDDNE